MGNMKALEPQMKKLNEDLHVGVTGHVLSGCNAVDNDAGNDHWVEIAQLQHLLGTQQEQVLYGQMVEPMES